MTTLERVHGDDGDVLTGVGALRLEAWGRIIGQDAAEARFGIDDHDAGAWHCLVLDDGALVAAGRLTVHPSLDDLPESTTFGP
ncbi:MAG: hypothetical protein ACJ73V_02315, partial [Acidimicrobiia bacterium]